MTKQYENLVRITASKPFHVLEKLHDRCETKAVRTFYRHVIQYKLDGVQRNNNYINLRG